MKLYEIDEQIQNCFDEETGELLNEEKLNALQIERDKKIENVALWIKDLKADVNALKEEEKSLHSRRQTKEITIESLYGYLLNATEGQKFETPRCRVSFRHSVKVEITGDVDKAFLIEPQPKIDKRAIRDAIKAGQTVEGAELVETTSVQVK